MDSRGLCLTRGEESIDDQFIIYVDLCVGYDEDEDDVEDDDYIDSLKRQTWIIENTAFTNEQFIIRATCEEKAIKRLYSDETKDH